MEKMLLRLVRLFDPLFRKQGVNTEQLHKIVALKLTMDNRRVYMNWKVKQQKERSNRMWVNFLVYGLMSLFFSGVISGVDNILFSMVLFHAYLIVLMSMVLITDFSTVMLDTTDNVVILPRPVNSRTLFMARLVHIVVYLLQFYIALTAIPIVATFITYGWIVGIVFILTSLMAVLLAVSLTYFMYLLFLMYSSEEKLKDVITYVQIIMAVIFMAGYQVLPRLIDFSHAMEVIKFRWYFFLIPFFWMAYTIEVFYTLNFDIIHVGMIGLTVFVPLILYFILNKYLAPSFAHKLAAINTDEAKATKKTKGGARDKKGLSEKISSIVCSKSLERSGFNLMWKVSGREKFFRLQFYPTLAYMVVMAFVFMFKKGHNIGTLIESLRESNSFLWFIYLPLMILSASIALMGFSENFMASWIYQSTPLKKPGELITGAMKALLVKYFLPIYLFLFALSFYIWHSSIVDDFVLGTANLILCFVVIKTFSKHYLPLSRQPNTKETGGRFALLLLQFLAIAVMVGLHYVLIYLKIDYLILPLAVISFTISWLIFKSLKNLKWQEISI